MDDHEITRQGFEAILGRYFVFDLTDQDGVDRLWVGWLEIEASEARLAGQDSMLEPENASRLHSAAWFEELMERVEDRDFPEASMADHVALYLSSTPPFRVPPRPYCPSELIGQWRMVARGSRYEDRHESSPEMEITLHPDGRLEHSDSSISPDRTWCVHRDPQFDELWFRDPDPPHNHIKHILRETDDGISLEVMDWRGIVSRWVRSTPRAASRRRPRRWTRTILGLYMAAALAGAGVLGHALAGPPAEAPTVLLTEDQDAQVEARQVQQWLASGLPTSADWFAPGALFDIEDRLRGVLSPSQWQLDNTTSAERVARLNQSLASFRAEYLNAAWLLGVVFAAGALFAGIALLRPNLGTAFAVFLCPLFTTPIATEPLIGVDNPSLFYLTLPMLITGGALLLIAAGRAMGASVSGARGEAWMRVWVGLGLIVLGGAASAASVALASATNAGVMAVAVGPVLYGVFSVLWGLAGVLRRRRRG